MSESRTPEDRCRARALASRFLSEGPEAIWKDLVNKGPKLEKRLERLRKPVSEREMEKWKDKNLTAYQWWCLAEYKELGELFEEILSGLI